MNIFMYINIITFLFVLGVVFKVFILWQMKYILDLEDKIKEKEDKITELESTIKSVQFQLKLEKNENNT